jgi:predicted nucleic acid-binding protein
MPVVLDVSSTLSWLFEDERDDLAIAMAEGVLERGAIVPGLWRLEVRNALLAAERRGRLTRTQVDDILGDLRNMPIEIAADASALEPESERTLARKYGLSVYDATYLDVAIRAAVPLMTRDAHLGRAAEDLQLRWQPGNREPETSSGLSKSNGPLVMKERSEPSPVTLRKSTRSESDRRDREEWRSMTSPEKLSLLWELTLVWMDAHGIPAEQRRLQRTVVALQRRRR